MRRLSRLQTNYLHRGTTLGISNEVVTYRPGGAAQAMREVTRHATTCPKHKIDPGENNLPPLLFTITRMKDSALLKGYLAVQIRVRGRCHGELLVRVENPERMIFGYFGMRKFQDHPDIFNAGFISDAEKEYAEANLTLALLARGEICDPGAFPGRDGPEIADLTVRPM